MRVIFIITILICFISSIFMSNTKVIGFFALMVFAYLAGSPDPNHILDYSVYENHYNILKWEVSPFEKGYTNLSLLFYNRGLEYAQFRLIFAILACVILFVGVCLFTKKVALFAGLYGITVFFNDATQIRNLMMISLVILGAGLFARKNKVSKVTGIIALFFATQFHDLGFVYLIIIPIFGFFNMKTLRKIYTYAVGILFFLGFFFSIGNKSKIVQLISQFLTSFSSRSSSAENVVNNFGRGNSLSNVILVWCSLALFSITLIILLDAVSGVIPENSVKAKILFLGSATAMIVVYLILLAPDYSRISRNSFLFLLLLLCFVLENKRFTRELKPNIIKYVIIISTLFAVTYVNTTIWGPNYYQTIPYLAKIKK